MNNYFGIGLDAKIALDFHQKREEHPEKCRSRTKNMMWFGVLGGKEIVAKTFKNLEQKVKLECDGQPIPLPNLQGIVVLNIPRFVCLICYCNVTFVIRPKNIAVLQLAQERENRQEGNKFFFI
jgi:hypothetical protein